VHDQLLVALANQAGDGCRLYELRSITYDGDYAHGERRGMIVARAVRNGLSVARDVAKAATGATSHALWWLDYRVGGGPRQTPDPRRRRARRR
jgi:hypothetical protein